MTRDKIFFGYIRVLRDTHRAICYERGDHHDEVETAYSVGADAIEKSRAPTTLDEALRDYAMFGKFVAKAAPVFYRGDKLTDFIAVWGHPEPYRFIGMFPEFVAFVKSELGLE